MKKNILPLLLLAAAPAAYAQKLSPATQMAIAGQGTATQTALTTAGSAAETTIRAFITTDGSEEALQALEAIGVKTGSASGDLVTATLTTSQLTKAAALPMVKKIQAATEVRLLMDDSRKYSNANPAHQSDNTLGRAYMGEGVVVGVVDTGFEYAHVDYLSPEGRFRIKRVWDQNSYDTSAQTPEAYGYGREYTTEAAIKQAKYDNTSQYHGGHVTGIAAGGDMKSAYYGVAPEADLVLVSFKNDNTCIADGVKYVFDYAKSVGKPAVVNLSLGDHEGPHDGTSAIDRYFDSIAGEGNIIVGAAGNEGSTKLHAQKTFTATDTQLKCGIQFATTKKHTRVDIWGTEGKSFKVQGVIFDANKGSVVASTPEVSTDAPTTSAQKTEFYSSSCGADGTVSLASETNETNGRPHVLLEVQLTNISASRLPGLIVTGEDGTRVDLWNVNGTLSGGKKGWTSGDTKYTVGEIGGVGNSVISVGSYHTKNVYTTISGNMYSGGESLSKLKPGELSIFSSVGPTLDGRMKPEITAPGWLVVSACSKYYTSFVASEAVAMTSYDGNKYYYDANGGTSMASPYVTGSVALWLEACPTLTADDIRSILKETAINDEYTEAGSNEWGYGKIDTYAGLAAAVKKQTGIARVPGTDILPRADLAQSLGRLTVTFRQDQGKSSVALFNAQGMRVSNATLPATTTGSTVTFDTAALTPGVYLVRVTSEQGQPQTFKVSVR